MYMKKEVMEEITRKRTEQDADTKTKGILLRKEQTQRRKT